MWKEEGEGPRQGLAPPAIGTQRGFGNSVLPPFLRRPTGEWEGAWAAGQRAPLLSLCPLPVLCVTLGKSPSAVGLLSGVCNRDSAAVTYVSGIPTHLSPLARSCGARPSSHICGNGEVLAPIDLHSSPKIFSLCKFSECIIYFSLKITQSLMETVPICSVSGDCRVGTMPAGHLSSGVSCHTLRGYHRRGFLIP